MPNSTDKTVLKVLLGIFCIGVVGFGISILWSIRRMDDEEIGLKFSDEKRVKNPPPVETPAEREARITKATTLLTKLNPPQLIISYPSNYDHRRESEIKPGLNTLLDKFLAEINKTEEFQAQKGTLLDVLVIVSMSAPEIAHYFRHPGKYVKDTVVSILKNVAMIKIKGFNLGYFPYAELFLFFPDAVVLDFTGTKVPGGFKNIDLFTKAITVVLNDTGMETILDLSKMSDLDCLSLSDNKLSGTISLVGVLPPTLLQLDLDGNRGISKIEGLETLKKLESLGLDKEVLDKPGLCDFRSVEKVNPNLTLWYKIK